MSILNNVTKKICVYAIFLNLSSKLSLKAGTFYCISFFLESVVKKYFSEDERFDFLNSS